MKQAELLRELLQEIDQVPDHQVQEIIAGERGHLVAVQSVRMGIATWAVHHPVPIQNVPLIQARGSARVLARSILSEDPMEATIGLASLNSMLPSPPAHQLQSIKAQELIVRCGRGKKVAVIGHFPFIEELADEFSDLWILEKSPRPGDIKAEEAPHILPLADLVAISATTLANGTLAEILSCCSTTAKKVMLGPSTPFVPSLFRCGIHVLAGSVVEDRELVKQGILAGLPFKRLKGARHLIWKV